MWPSLIIDYLNYACSRGTLHKEESQKLYEHGSGKQMGEVIYAPESHQVDSVATRRLIAKLIHRCSPFERQLCIVAYDYCLLETDRIGRPHL